MEKEGLARVLHFLQQQGLKISVLVTDRHRQINKWLRENHPGITHYYDVWHVAKGNKVYSNLFAIPGSPVSYIIIGLRKKLEAVSKQKDCEIIGQWQKSIVNHLYWCVASTPNGNGDIIKAKWLSLENHIHNVHIGHGSIFPVCTWTVK